MREGKSELVNTNKLVRFYEGTTGLKTGTTSNAGYCLSATAERNGLELVAVVMAGDTSGERFNSAKKLLDYGFSNYEYVSIKPKVDKTNINISNGVQKNLKIATTDSFGSLLKKGTSSAVTQQINLKENITAPIKKNDVVGTIDFFLDEQQIGQVDIIADESVNKISFLTAFLWILDGLLA